MEILNIIVLSDEQDGQGAMLSQLLRHNNHRCLWLWTGSQLEESDPDSEAESRAKYAEAYSSEFCKDHFARADVIIVLGETVHSRLFEHPEYFQNAKGVYWVITGDMSDDMSEKLNEFTPTADFSGVVNIQDFIDDITEVKSFAPFLDRKPVIYLPDSGHMESMVGTMPYEDFADLTTEVDEARIAGMDDDPDDIDDTDETEETDEELDSDDDADVEEESDTSDDEDDYEVADGEDEEDDAVNDDEESDETVAREEESDEDETEEDDS